METRYWSALSKTVFSHKKRRSLKRQRYSNVSGFSHVSDQSEKFRHKTRFKSENCQSDGETATLYGLT
jgi:hypothetical protein